MISNEFQPIIKSVLLAFPLNEIILFSVRVVLLLNRYYMVCSSVDLVVSCLGLHWTNDLPGAMIQVFLLGTSCMY